MEFVGALMTGGGAARRAIETCRLDGMRLGVGGWGWVRTDAGCEAHLTQREVLAFCARVQKQRRKTERRGGRCRRSMADTATTLRGSAAVSASLFTLLLCLLAGMLVVQLETRERVTFEELPAGETAVAPQAAAAPLPVVLWARRRRTADGRTVAMPKSKRAQKVTLAKTQKKGRGR